MSAGRWLDLLGTLKSGIKLGLGGVFLKNSSGNLLIRNTGDSADAEITASKANISGDDLVLNSDAAGSGADWTMTLRRPSSGMAANVVFPLPVDAGSTGDVLTKTASGSEWAAPGGGGGAANVSLVESVALAFGTASPLALLTTTANEVIYLIRVHVDTVFNGTNPQLSIGIVGTTSKYMAATEIDLKTVGTYEVCPGLAAQGVEAIIGTYNADSSSAGAARIEIFYGTPA